MKSCRSVCRVPTGGLQEQGAFSGRTFGGCLAHFAATVTSAATPEASALLDSHRPLVASTGTNKKYEQVMNKGSALLSTPVTVRSEKSSPSAASADVSAADGSPGALACPFVASAGLAAPARASAVPAFAFSALALLAASRRFLESVSERIFSNA